LNRRAAFPKAEPPRVFGHAASTAQAPTCGFFNLVA
jgi:hypothetical protein